MTSHMHQMETVNLIHLAPCRVCGITEEELVRIYDDRQRGTDGTQRTTDQVDKPDEQIS